MVAKLRLLKSSFNNYQRIDDASAGRMVFALRQLLASPALIDYVRILFIEFRHPDIIHASHSGGTDVTESGHTEGVEFISETRAVLLGDTSLPEPLINIINQYLRPAERPCCQRVIDFLAAGHPNANSTF